jgi:hypothetical protein
MKRIMINKTNPHLLENLTKKQPCVIFFHMDGCGHCEGVKKVWPGFKRNMCQKHKTKIPFIDVNSDALPLIDNNKFNIRGFPSIVKSLPNNDTIEEFNGPDRSKESLIKWFESKFNRELSKPKKIVMTKKFPILRKKITLKVNKKKSPRKRKSLGKKKKKSPRKRKSPRKKNKKARGKIKTLSPIDSMVETPRSDLFS